MLYWQVHYNKSPSYLSWYTASSFGKINGWWLIICISHCHQLIEVIEINKWERCIYIYVNYIYNYNKIRWWSILYGSFMKAPRIRDPTQCWFLLWSLLNLAPVPWECLEAFMGGAWWLKLAIQVEAEQFVACLDWLRPGLTQWHLLIWMRASSTWYLQAKTTAVSIHGGALNHSQDVQLQ